MEYLKTPAGANAGFHTVHRMDNGRLYKSHGSPVAFKPFGGGTILLDKRFWNYSNVTNRYRNQFLGSTLPELRRQIAAGEAEIVPALTVALTGEEQH